MVDSEDQYSTEKASSVQSAILHDCDAEALSVEVLKFDTPSGSPNNCPGARGVSVRVQISVSRPVSFFMVKPRFCPSRDQSSPVQSSRPLGFGQVLSDQPAASRLEHFVGVSGLRPYRPDYCDPKDCGLSRGDLKDCGPQSVESSFSWPLWVVDIKAMRFPLLQARSWQEAKSNLVALGKDDRIAGCWTLGPPV
ncbi:hypothetical protein YC2023_018780 [Brassica napus]